MKILGIDDSIEQDIISIAIKNDIKKLILFGSRARGDFKRTSDIDLAVEGGNISAFAVQVMRRFLHFWNLISLIWMGEYKKNY